MVRMVSSRNNRSHGRNYQNIGQRRHQDQNQQKGDNQNNNWYEPKLVSDIRSSPTVVSVKTHSNSSNSLTPPVVSQSKPVENYDWCEEKQKMEEAIKLPVGGRLLHFAHKWKGIGASNKVCRWLRRGYRLPFAPQGEEKARSLFSKWSPTNRIPNYATGTQKAECLTFMMKTLIDKAVIVEMKEEEFGFFNMVFLRPKKHDPTETRLDKIWRLILDVSPLNKFLVYKHFQMETVEKIRKCVSTDMFATSIDLTDAYHHIPIHPNFHNFLSFQVADRKFKYIALPFGLSPAPQIFTEVMTPLKIYAKENFGGNIFQYIDDWLIIDNDRDKVLQVSIKLIHLLIDHGMLVNLGKSHLTPSQTLTHLGVTWNFKDATIACPEKQIVSISTEAKIIGRKGRALISRLESLLGKLVAFEKVVPFGRINYRPLQRSVLNHLKHGRSPRYVTISSTAKQDLLWWSNPNNLKSSVPCIPPKPNTVIATDASLSGWGAVGNDLKLSYNWNSHESKLHINELELLAVLKTLETVATDKFFGRTINFLIDNKTAVSYINKQGGTRSCSLNQITRKILSFAEKHKMTLQASYIKGNLNSLADLLSRSQSVVKGEWQLSKKNFRWICSATDWGCPTIDLFANRFNHQTDRYMSPCPDQEAFAIDALLANWPEEVLYAFPPSTIMESVIVKIKQERPRKLLLVAPNWSTTTWFCSLRSMAQSSRRIPELQLLQPISKLKHPTPESTSLVLWIISFQD